MATLQPFRFGIAGEHAKTREEWVAKAQRAEELGYHIFLVPDHFWVDVSPIPALMAAADATRSIRIGTHVIANDFRNPAMLARDIATLDMLSGGRFQFGFGIGYLPADYQQGGVRYDSPLVRVDRFKEALTIIKQYFTEEAVNFSGRYYQVKNLKANGVHVQKPYPPLYMGSGRKRMLSLAAREADIVGFGPISDMNGPVWADSTVAAATPKLEWVRAAAGARFHSLELATAVFIIAVTDHQQGAAQGIAAKLGITPEQVLDSLQILVGSADQIAETLLQRRERLGISYIQIGDAHLEALAPVIAKLAGA